MYDCMVVMFDNLLIGGTDFDDLQEKLVKFFTICRHHNVLCKMAKSKFGQDLLSAGLMQLTIVNNIYYGMRYFFGCILMDYHEYIKNYNDIQVI